MIVQEEKREWVQRTRAYPLEGCKWAPPVRKVPPFPPKLPHVPISVFESTEGEMLSVIYCFGSTETFREYLADEEFQEMINCPLGDALTDLMHKPLNLEFWEDGSFKETVFKIEATIRNMKQGLNRYKETNAAEIYLDQIRRGFLSFCKKGSLGMEEENNFKGIYDHFRLVSGLNYYKAIYMGLIDVEYKQTELDIWLDGRTGMKMTLYSAYNNADIFARKIIRIVEQRLGDYRDFLTFDPKTKREIKPSATLKQVSSHKVYFSELVTNLQSDELARTFKFTYSKDPTVFFLLTFESGKWTKNVDSAVKERVKKLLQLTYRPELKIKYGKDEGALTSNFNNMVHFFSLLQKAHEAKGSESYLKVEFEVEGSCFKPEPVPFQIESFSEPLSPASVIETFYEMKSRKMIENELSAQVLILQYKEKLGVEVCKLAQDFKSKWLDCNPLTYYELKGVMIHIFRESGPLCVPVVKTASGEWFVPVYNYTLKSLEGLDIKALIYEKSYECFR